MSESAIEIEGLRATRGTFTLEVPHFEVASGSVLGVVGPNGAGKTTLLRLLPGLDRADAGRVRVLGRDPVVDATFVRERLGFMSDDLAVYDVSIARLLHIHSGYYPTWDAAHAARLVDRFELDLGARPSRLSRGQGTRLRLLLALAFRPQVLVLDEPGSGLDLTGRQGLLQSVLEAVREQHASVVISSHQLADVERIVDSLLVLHRGGVVRAGAIETLVPDDRTLEEAMVAWGAV